MRITIGPLLFATLLATSSRARAHEFLQFEHLHGGNVHSVVLLSTDLGFSAEDGGRIRRWTRDPSTGNWSFEHLDSGYDSRYQLRDIRFADAQNGWAVGYGGRISRTTDGGQSWGGTASPFLTKPGSSELADLYSVRFVFDAAVGVWRGWIVGFDGVIYRSDDAGDSWQALTLPSGYAGNDLYGLAVQQIGTSTYRVWVTGDFGTALRSSDGGQSWDVVQSLSPAACTGSNLELWDIEMRPDGLGIIAAGVGTGCGESFYTTNAGVSWTAIPCFNPVPPSNAWSTAYGVALGGSQAAVTCGYASQANVLTSPPLCWTPTTDLSLSYLGHPPTFGIAAYGDSVLQSGMFNLVRASNDGGLTWSNQAGLDYLRTRDAAFVDDQTGCIVGQGYRILRSTDGMQTFTQVHIGPNLGPNMNGVAFSPAQTANWLAVGDNESNYPYVARSTDQGATWTRLSSASFPLGTTGLKELAFHPTNASVALVVGANKRVLRTANLGTSFTNWNSGIGGNPELRSVGYTASADAFVVGTPASGFSAWRSVGGANAWAGVPLKDTSGGTLTSVNLNAVACGAGEVWAVGDGGLMFRYDAGANAFQQVVPVNPPYDPTEDLVGVAIHASATETHVIVGGGKGGIRYTNGTIWTSPRSRLSGSDGAPDGARLSAISVFPMPDNPDGFRGYVFGRQMQVARFVSPGATF